MRSTCSISLYIVAQNEQTSDRFWRKRFPHLGALNSRPFFGYLKKPYVISQSFSGCRFLMFLALSLSCSLGVNQRRHISVRYIFVQLTSSSSTTSYHFNHWRSLAMSFFRSFLRPSSIIPNSQPLLNLSLRQPQINAFSTTSSTLVKQKLKSHSASKKRFFPNASGMVRISSLTTCCQTLKANVRAYHSSSSVLKQANLIWTPLSLLLKSTGWPRAFMWLTLKWVFLSFRLSFSSHLAMNTCADQHWT